MRVGRGCDIACSTLYVDIKPFSKTKPPTRDYHAYEKLREAITLSNANHFKLASNMPGFFKVSSSRNFLLARQPSLVA